MPERRQFNYGDNLTKPEFCKQCPIDHTTNGYVPLCQGFSPVLFVGESAGAEEIEVGRPFVGGAGRWLDSILKAAKINRNSINIVNVIGCKPPGNVFPSSREWSATNHADGHTAVDWCRSNHFLPALGSRNWNRIIALGNEALKALTGRSGISKWRGSPLPLKAECKHDIHSLATMRSGFIGSNSCSRCDSRGWYWSKTCLVMPTLHPAYLMRNATMFSTVVQDVQKSLTVPPENYTLFGELKDLQAFDSKVFAFDLEWGEYGDITICGLSDKHYRTLVVDWSPTNLPELKRIFENATDIIGQNIIGADMRYLDRIGWNVRARLHDIMLMHHLIMPDYRHDLGTIASQFTNKVFWKGRDTEEEEEDGTVNTTGAQWKTWDKADGIPRELGGYGGCASAGESFRLYNARDTDSSYQAWWPILAKVKQYGMDNIYWNLSVPVAHECRRMADLGIRIDRDKIAEINRIKQREIVELEAQLPEGLRPRDEEVTKNEPTPKGTYRPKQVKCKGTRKDKHEVQTFTFNAPGEMVCGCGKTVRSGKMVEAKIIKVPATERIVPWNSTQQVQKYAESIGCKPVTNKKSGRATADKNARKVWGREHLEFTIVDQLKKRKTLLSNFAKEKLLSESRVYFNLLVHGTAEGRLSSSGKRKGIDPNIQNQPDDVRYIYVPDNPGWGILDVDWVQGENFLTAHLAQDSDRMNKLLSGIDEHSELASTWFQCEVTKKNENAYLRDAGKIMNHGLNYGAGPYKIQELLAINGFNYPLSDVKAGIDGWRKINRGTYEWQQRTVRLAEAQGYLVNPFGRKRWFQSRDFATKALAFLPASTLADMMLRTMIALYPNRWAVELVNLGVKVTGALPTNWDLRWPVHDSLVLQGPDEYHIEAQSVVQAIMGQQWSELDGFALNSSAKYSTVSWGDCK